MIIVKNPYILDNKNIIKEAAESVGALAVGTRDTIGSSDDPVVELVAGIGQKMVQHKLPWICRRY